MKILHRYITGGLVVGFMFALGTFSFVLLTGNAMRLVRLLAAGMSLADFFVAVLLLFPYVLVFAIPMALLTANLLVFARMSAEREITAMRASGISLYQVISPAILFAVVLSLLCCYLNTELAPRSRYQLRLHQARVLQKDPLAILAEGTATDLDRFVISVQRREGTRLMMVSIAERLPDGRWKQLTRAREGRLEIDPQTQTAKLTLTGVITEVYIGDSDREAHTPRVIPGQEVVQEFDLASLFAQREAKKRLSDLTLFELVDEVHAPGRKPSQVMSALVETHKRMAFSLAGFAFVLLSIPVGIRASRRETAVGIALSLVLVFAYYLFIILAESMADNPAAHPIALVWTPNFLFEGLGLYLLHRTVQG